MLDLWYWFKATLTLETRIGYICNTHGYQREVCSWNEAYITIRDGAPKTAAKSVAPIVFTCGSLIKKGQIQVSIRLKAEEKSHIAFSNQNWSFLLLQYGWMSEITILHYTSS